MSSSSSTTPSPMMIPDEFRSKLEVLKNKLGSDNLSEALDKSLNIANFVADTVKDPKVKLLVEQNGKYTELYDIPQGS